MTAATSRLVFLLTMGLSFATCASQCRKKTTTTDDPAIASAVASADPPPPPVYNGTPLKEFADAAAIDGKPPIERSQFFYDDGQYWLARLLIEPTAFSEDSPKAEAELLAKICQAQLDQECLDKCSRRLGRKLVMGDAGARDAGAAPEHKEPDTDAARARALVLDNKDAEARAILEPKVLGGKPAPEEVRLLRAICKRQKDQMCVALCDTKVKK